MVGRGLLLIACAAALSACSPPMSSVMGVAADADGKPVGVVAVCAGGLPGLDRHYTNLADLEVWDGPGNTGSPRPIESGRWFTDEPVTDLGTWSLTTGEPWTTQAPITLRDGYTYYLSGTGRSQDGWSNESLSKGIEFTLADVAALEPGQVRYRAQGDVMATEPTFAVVPLEDFREAVCR